MATILRSSRYIRRLSNLSRRIAFTSNDANTVSKLKLDASVCSSSPSFVKSYASKVAVKESSNLDINNELSKLNEDAKRFGRLRRVDVDNVLRNVKETKKLSSTQALMLISCCGNLLVDETPDTRLATVKEIWNLIEHLDVPVDISHYNALLKVYLENEYSFSPLNFLVELEKRNIEPNRVTYQRFITRYCNNGDIAGATKILEFMKEKQLPVNENVFNSLITGHARAGNLENAVNVLNVMKQGGVNPSATTYATLLCAYAEKGDIEAIRNTLATCQSQEIFLMDKDYMDIVYSLVLKGHKQYIEEIMSLSPKSAGYAFDATNLVHKLINIGEIDIALQVLLSVPRKVRNDGRTSTVGTYFVRKLVFCNVSPEKIIETCKFLESKELNNQAFSVAIEASFLKGNAALSIQLLEAWKETGATIKQHFFWPLFVAHGNQSNFQGILDTIDVMITKFELNPSIYTLKEYVLPHAVGSIEQIANALMEHNIQPLTIINAFAYMLLESGKSKEAYEFMVNYSTRLLTNILIRPLLDAFIINGDVESFVNVTRLLHESADLKDKDNEDEIEEAQQIRFNVPDTLLFRLLKMKSTKKVEVIEKILEGFTQQGFTISAEVANAVKESFSDKVTPKMSELLSQLTSGNLALNEIPRQNKSRHSIFLKKDLENIKAKGGSTNGLSKRLLIEYITAKDEENVSKLLKELHEGDFVFNAGLYAQLIDFYSAQENLSEAEKYFKELKNLDSSTRMDFVKTLRYAILLVKNDRHSEALQLIKDLPTFESMKEDKTFGETFLKRSVMLTRQLLNLVAEKSDPDQLNEFFEAIESKHLAQNVNAILNSLVKVHLIRNDLETALNTFEKLALQYKCTPYKQELAKKYILAEDAASLQRLTDISTQVHGEVNSLQDLAIAFIECDRIRQAKKIFETPGLFARDHRLITAAQNYAQDENKEYLQKLLEATKNTLFSNRSELYNLLLSVHYKDNNWTEGLATWTMMQEEDIQPSEKFLQQLATLLLKNGQDVPFVYEKPRLNFDNSSSKLIKNIEEHIKRREFQRIAKILDRKSNAVKSAYVVMIGRLLDAEALDDAIEFTKCVVTRHPKIIQLNEFQSLMEKLGQAGKVDDITKIQELIPSAMSSTLFFNKYLLKAYMAAGKIEQFLENLEKKVISTPGSKWPNLLHNNVMLNILESEPSVVEKYKPYAEKLAEHGFIVPMNILWCYYFLNSNPNAEEIWSKYLVNSEKLFTKLILYTVDKNNDIELLKELVKKVQESNMSLQNRANAYNDMISLYNKKGLFQEGLELLNEIVKEVPLETVKASILQRLKEGIEKSGHSFPYILEPRQANAASA
ncbi:leucine-rich PPR motif-containing protein, mitochondrial isoform X2 [Cephus cinctus]|uniref:Leucine-rich PPR motif-containing protein, mitochondrial isoform X2 n=1 Tax=Cephus cinctus TaxID=211228 RepID=A0AAJ7BLF3_CEPCN|nr:leucine-rich PPR motif-containing protein, mitochondrial isoform X2 [Cephus cinctus]